MAPKKKEPKKKEDEIPMIRDDWPHEDWSCKTGTREYDGKTYYIHMYIWRRDPKKDCITKPGTTPVEFMTNLKMLFSLVKGEDVDIYFHQGENVVDFSRRKQDKNKPQVVAVGKRTGHRIDNQSETGEPLRHNIQYQVENKTYAQVTVHMTPFLCPKKFEEEMINSEKVGFKGEDVKEMIANALEYSLRTTKESYTDIRWIIAEKDPGPAKEMTYGKLRDLVKENEDSGKKAKGK